MVMPSYSHIDFLFCFRIYNGQIHSHSLVIAPYLFIRYWINSLLIPSNSLVSLPSIKCVSFVYFIIITTNNDVFSKFWKFDIRENVKPVERFNIILSMFIKSCSVTMLCIHTITELHNINGACIMFLTVKFMVIICFWSESWWYKWTSWILFIDN